MKTYIKGHFKQSFYEKDNYIVGLFKVNDTNDENLEIYVNRTITFTGYFDELNTFDTYIFYGKEIEHPRYGYQFQTEGYEKTKPTEKEGIIEFLSSDLFKGIGEKLATSIVEVLGPKALDDILKDPSVLNLVPKMTQKKIDNIYYTLKKYDESHNSIVFLSDIGFSIKDSLNIYNKYGSSCVNVVDENIYNLIGMKDIGFLKIDQIALKNGIEPLDKRRIESAIMYVITNLIYQNGDLFLTKDVIVKNVFSFFKTEIDNIDDYIDKLVNNQKLKKDNDDYYLMDIWDKQNNIINKIFYLVTKEKKDNKNILKKIKELESTYDIQYNNEQIEAIEKALNNNILIITGGPGSGKTTIIKAICEIYKKINKLSDDKLIDAVALLAPTGRAAKRMSQSTNLPASTIHRFLKWNKENNEFMINENNKDKSNLIIVDESSMIDINLFDSLLKGLSTNIKLILVGDYNQLPSVEPGNLLKDFILSNEIETVYLNRIYRQDEYSYIPTFAKEINEGILSDTFNKQTSDYVFLECLNSSIKTGIKNVSEMIKEKGYDYKQFQFLAPMYKGENGIDLINVLLQNIFNPKTKSKNEIKYGTVTYREGDKVLQLINMPDNNVFNGDIGIISSIKNNEIYIDFDDNLVKYTAKDLNKIKHGYIISIHKSQGSEFDIVVMPMSLSYNRMLYRKLIYTGVTRARKKLILIGQKEALLKSVGNNTEYKRNSKLKEKLMYKFEK